jgi:hypothetical protein
VPLVLKRAQGIEDNEVTDVQIRRRGVKSQLDPQLVSPLESSLQVLRDVDLNRPLAQAIEEFATHGVTG